ncbi:MAG TPA: substrate-binding domain-containing protein [Vicinamibacterales bacterium]|nr:substrate-binding domain-containing protein [Vicinamibacterales bacterium]
MSKPCTTAAMILAALLLAASSADGAELRVLASNGVKAAVEALKPQLEKASGSTLSIEFSTAATLRERIEKGEAFDVAILTDEAMAALVKAGKLSPMLTKLARVGIGVGFREGAARPDVRTPAAIKQSLLNAKAIAYTGNGASRPAIDRMIERLGVAKEMQAKSHLTAAGAAPASVAKGESDLVLTLISEILPERGVALAGPLPSDFQAYLGFSAAASAKAAGNAAAAKVIAFLHGSAAAATYNAKGMEVTQ